MALWTEIRRRKVFQVAAAYAVVSWLLIQVITSVEAPLNLPDWVDTTVIVFLAIGFPVALVLAWIFDVTPDGITVSPPADAPTHVTAQPQGNRFVQVTQMLVLLAVGFLVFDQYWLPDSVGAREQPVQQTIADLAVTRFSILPPPAAPLASTSGYDVAISRDGRRLAWVTDDIDNDGHAIYVRDLDEFDARRIVDSEYLTAASGDNYNPFFSPDGSEIAFQASGALFRVSISGGEPRRFADGIGVFIGGTWGSDDSIIYSGSGILYRVAASGGSEPEILLGDAALDGSYLAPHLLPDGRSLLASVIDGENAEYLVSINLDTGEHRALIDGGVQNPRYTESGHIAFARGSELLFVPFDPSELAVSGEPQLVAQGIRWAAGNAADFALSLSGTLAYISGNPDGDLTANELVWVGRDGSLLDIAVSGPIQPAVSDPRLSPDSRRLVVSRGENNSEGVTSLWIFDLSGRPPIPLTVTVGADLFPVWSPDGREIVFTSNRRQFGAFEMYRVPSDGSARILEPLDTSGYAVGATDWMPSDELIVVQTGDSTGADILVTRPQSDAEFTELVVTEFNEYSPSVSSNGRWLAFVSDRTGESEIWVMTYPDGAAVRVSPNGGIEPRWSPDDSELHYLQGNAMMSVAFDAQSELEFSNPELLFSGDFLVDPSSFRRSFDVAPDGRFLMMRSADVSQLEQISDNQDIYVIQNWSNELTEPAL
jgi:Tol biopolymer transport system component